jgi:hypothetical protein
MGCKASMMDLAGNPRIAVAWAYFICNLTVVFLFLVILDLVEPRLQKWLATHMKEHLKLEGEAYEHLSSNRV